MVISPGYDRSVFGDDWVNIDQKFIIKDMVTKYIYTRGVETITDLDMIAGEIIIEYDERTGVDISIGDGSFWVEPDLLDFGGGPFEPALHDKITNDLGVVFDVVAPGRLDPERAMFNIPTVRVEYIPEPGSS